MEVYALQSFYPKLVLLYKWANRGVTCPAILVSDPDSKDIWPLPHQG
jgi:hypothetical protein